MNHPPQAKKYYEDFETDFKYEYQVPGLSAEEIKEFADRTWPQIP